MRRFRRNQGGAPLSALDYFASNHILRFLSILLSTLTVGASELESGRVSVLLDGSDGRCTSFGSASDVRLGLPASLLLTKDAR